MVRCWPVDSDSQEMTWSGRGDACTRAGPLGECWKMTGEG